MSPAGGTPPLALTGGDPAGIGPEITLRVWLERRADAVPAFCAIADPALLRATAERLGWDVPVREAGPEDTVAIFPDALPVCSPGVPPVPVTPGRPDPATAAGTIAAIETAVRWTAEGRAGAVVTNPIAKSVLAAAGFPHPGHTEFLARLAAPPGVEPPHPVMMLWSPVLAVVPVTVHIPLRAVPGALTADLICRTGRIVAADLRDRFGIAAPRLAVAGLNPHAGEGGLLGTEDDAIVRPAVERLRQEGIAATGPHPADTMFHERARAGFDAALCAYHDQALIPLKTLAFDDGVNCTLGLPFIRTSPDHGTAFDIAGRGIARPDSLRAALRLAARLAARGRSGPA